MLTQDENIVDIRFTVQYTLKDARAFLFENRDTEQAVVQAAESAVREIVGRSKVDGVLYERAMRSPPSWSSPSRTSSTV
jgi:membrane protease subunit HflK